MYRIIINFEITYIITCLLFARTSIKDCKDDDDHPKFNHFSYVFSVVIRL